MKVCSKCNKAPNRGVTDDGLCPKCDYLRSHPDTPARHEITRSNDDDIFRNCQGRKSCNFERLNPLSNES
jgi:hypothetical protein